MNDLSDSDGGGSDSFSDVNQAPGSDSTPPGDDDLLSVFVGPESSHYFTHAFSRFAAGGSVKWNWPVLFTTLSWLLYRKMWLYSLGYMIGVPVLFMIMAIIMALLAELDVVGKAAISIFFTPYVVIAFILAPMFATRLYYAHARKKIRNIKVRTQSVEEQRLEVARAGSTSIFSTFAAVFLPLVVIGGIIVAPTFFAHYTYTVRAQVSEGLNLAGGAKIAVTEYYQEYKQLPSDNAATGLSPATDIHGKYVSSVRVEAGEIVISFGNEADSDISGHTLVLRPEVSDRGISFVCSSFDIADKHLPAACR